MPLSPVPLLPLPLFELLVQLQALPLPLLAAALVFAMEPDLSRVS
jgi:hypothetical protein